LIPEAEKVFLSKYKEGANRAKDGGMEKMTRLKIGSFILYKMLE